MLEIVLWIIPVAILWLMLREDEKRMSMLRHSERRAERLEKAAYKATHIRMLKDIRKSLGRKC